MLPLRILPCFAIALLSACAGAPPVPGGASAAPPPRATFASPPSPSLVAGGHLRVRFLDVGQGDAALVTTDDGASVLLDLGPKEALPVVRNAVASLGGKVGVLLLSHAHADHMGELDTFAREVNVGAFWDSGFAERPTKTYPRALALFETRHVPHVVARRGMHFPLGAHADLEVLGPREPLFDKTRSDPNANSVVVRVSHLGTNGGRAVRILFTGDAETPTETRLLEAPSDLAADVLKVAHHGSKHASSATFLRAVNAKLAVISCAADNDYGHPHLAALKRLVAAGTTVHRTDLEGDITVDSEAGRVSVTSAREATETALATPGRSPARGAEDAP